MAQAAKGHLDELHLRKIDIADEVVIVGGEAQAGESTRREINYARENGVRVTEWADITPTPHPAAPAPAPAAELAHYLEMCDHAEALCTQAVTGPEFRLADGQRRDAATNLVGAVRRHLAAALAQPAAPVPADGLRAGLAAFRETLVDLNNWQEDALEEKYLPAALREYDDLTILLLQSPAPAQAEAGVDRVSVPIAQLRATGWRTMREWHEEAAGYGLAEMFFTFNGIDPNAYAPPTQAQAGGEGEV
ncbi:hypothetical protein DEIPH_ctg052orf0033 [Deinococcus phoenicis]|uniref:Uncharacterized protein n=2 Tax=Deinococcus phoenicis TaxID=1476583 RepID=A0A016QMH0_9DEIO|nr:hypothetical protein DEIPH_ctg052orf0033 [Deinococcus phoenicis]